LERTFLRWQIGLVFYSLMSVPLAVGALAAAWRRRWLVALGVGALDGFYIVCAAATLIYGRARSGEV
jgi:hypothetical protein